MRKFKFLPWLILIGLSVLAGFFAPNLTSQFEGPVDYQKPTKNETIKVILAGDIMLDRGVAYMVEKYGNGDFKFPFLKIADYLQEADLVFGNLEGPISDKGKRVGSIYSFRADPQTIEGLVYAGFNILSLANNHAFDYGREALEDTLKRLKEADLNYVGAGFSANEVFSPVIKEINGVRISFLAYTNLGPETWQAKGENFGIAWISENDFEETKKDIQKAKSISDVLIVSLHAGEEYQKQPTQFQIDFSKTAYGAGADLVVGHHPHVVQPDFYSLGNFIFDQGFSEETMKGEVLEVLIEGNKIKEVIPREIRLNDFFQPAVEK